MHAPLRHAAFVIVSLLVYSAPGTLAQSPLSVNERCPTGYRFVDPVCANRSPGAVVNVTPAVPAPIVQEQGCAPGHWRVEQVCISRTTGDVELVEEQQVPKRNASSDGR